MKEVRCLRAAAVSHVGEPELVVAKHGDERGRRADDALQTADISPSSQP